MYYNFLTLVNANIIEEWRNSRNSEDYIEKFTKILIKKYGEDNAKRMIVLFYRLFLKILVTGYKR